MSGTMQTTDRTSRPMIAILTIHASRDYAAQCSLYSINICHVHPDYVPSEPAKAGGENY